VGLAVSPIDHTPRRARRVLASIAALLLALAASTSAAAPDAGLSIIAQDGVLRVTVDGDLSPRALPRRGLAPVSVSVGGRVSTTDRSYPPQLQSLRIELNRHGHLDSTGLPVCPYDRIQPASTARALAACRPSLVGSGSFTADITLANQQPYPTKGRMLVFNSRRRGGPVLFGQIYAPKPFATSFVIVFTIGHQRGTYGTVLDADLPGALGSWGNLTGLDISLTRRFTHRGSPRSYVSAGCPAPVGSRALFRLARTTFGFAGGISLISVITDSCTAQA
jgi:ABC-type amino acid transport substrate-binding protein